MTPSMKSFITLLKEDDHAHQLSRQNTRKARLALYELAVARGIDLDRSDLMYYEADELAEYELVAVHGGAKQPMTEDEIERMMALLVTKAQDHLTS